VIKLLSKLGFFAIILVMLVAAPTSLASSDGAQHFLCGGEPLEAIAFTGPVDTADIPNSSGGTLPGAFLVLRWRNRTLQLPRTNNAGVPSYTDGRWWWQALDPDHPEFAQLRGDVQQYRCDSEPWA
jgi:hypothetical protein